MIRIAILDLYEGHPNQGMRCLRQIVRHWSAEKGIPFHLDEFDVRLKNQVPSLSYDIYISSGGPGSPLASGSDWEAAYFNWIKEVETWNNHPQHSKKKFIFFICHSFQLACRYFGFAEVTKRKSAAFGVFPVHLTPDGENDPLFTSLNDPFYVVDSRNWQAVQPDFQKIRAMGADILCIEKDRPHVPYERAIMGLRFNPCMIGTQFHPEADAEGMMLHLQDEDKKEIVIKEYGEEKWRSMVEHLNDPDKIMWTYAHIIPNYLNSVIEMMNNPDND